MKRKLYTNYKNGLRISLSSFSSRDLYRLAFRIIRGWNNVRSVEIWLGTTYLKMYAREYAGGRYIVLSRRDGSIVSMWVLNGTGEGRDKNDH